MRHHEVQQKGRDEILADYHLRVGQITEDNRVRDGTAWSTAFGRNGGWRRNGRDPDQPDATH